MDHNKKMSVSFGAFSCVLEGYDDPVPVMQKLVDYFQEQAAQNPEFAATHLNVEPQASDASVLASTAEAMTETTSETTTGATAGATAKTAAAIAATTAAASVAATTLGAGLGAGLGARDEIDAAAHLAAADDLAAMDEDTNGPEADLDEVLSHEASAARAAVEADGLHEAAAPFDMTQVAAIDEASAPKLDQDVSKADLASEIFARDDVPSDRIIPDDFGSEDVGTEDVVNTQVEVEARTEVNPSAEVDDDEAALDLALAGAPVPSTLNDAISDDLADHPADEVAADDLTEPSALKNGQSTAASLMAAKAASLAQKLAQPITQRPMPSAAQFEQEPPLSPETPLVANRPEPEPLPEPAPTIVPDPELAAEPIEPLKWNDVEAHEPEVAIEPAPEPTFEAEPYRRAPTFKAEPEVMRDTLKEVMPEPVAASLVEAPDEIFAETSFEASVALDAAPEVAPDLETSVEPTPVPETPTFETTPEFAPKFTPEFTPEPAQITAEIETDIEVGIEALDDAASTASEALPDLSAHSNPSIGLDPKTDNNSILSLSNAEQIASTGNAFKLGFGGAIGLDASSTDRVRTSGTETDDIIVKGVKKGVFNEDGVRFAFDEETPADTPSFEETNDVAGGNTGPVLQLVEPPEETPEPAPILSAPSKPKDMREFAQFAKAENLDDLLEASAAFVTIVDGQRTFSRKDLMDAMDELPQSAGFSPEARIRAFSSMVNGGRIEREPNGQYALSIEAREYYRRAVGN